MPARDRSHHHADDKSFWTYPNPIPFPERRRKKNGRADDLRKELDALFESQNISPRKDATSIPATFLRVTVALD